MRRIVAAMAALLLFAPVAVLAGRGQGTPVPSGVAPPVASPVAGATGAALDLAAMALTPDDLAAAGLTGYGLRRGTFLSLDEAAARLASDRGKSAAEIRTELDAAGFRRGYENEIAVPLRSGTTSSQVRAFVATRIVEFATTAGAQSAFPLLASNAGEARRDQTTATYGDRSQAVLIRRGATLDGEKFQGEAITFRLGSLVASVTTGNLDGRLPPSGAVEALAARLEPKVRAGAAGPGLSERVLRLAGAGVATLGDGYGRLAGQTFANYDEPPDRAADRIARYAGATDVYGVLQSLPAGAPGQQDDVRYLSVLYRFADEQTASAWLGNAATWAAKGANVTSVAPVPDAVPVGPASTTLAITVERDQGGESRGIAVYVQRGDEVAQIQMIGVPDVPPAAVAALARDQLACLDVGACPRPAAVPPGLPPLLASPVAGTPVASPVAGTPVAAPAEVGAP